LPISVTSADELSKGDTLGRYEIIEQIAVGGMAQIYLGRVRGTAGFDKLVAIKRILPSVAIDSSFVEMFLAEARLAATLRHPNIADVFDVGRDGGSYFMAMEYIHGLDARDIRAEAESVGRGVPTEIALAIVSGVASALAYAHAKVGPTGPLNLVHRDISPSNILVSFDGAVKLVDFGIARAATNRSTQITRTGQLKGKIPYMSPEQCRAHPLDRRADLFSLGIVLYELTLGARPFDGKGDFDTLERIVHGTMRMPSQIRSDYPKALEEVVLRMLATKRRERYQTADQLLQALERVTSEAGLFASAFTLGRYMRDLFPREAAELPHIESDDPPTLRPQNLVDAALEIETSTRRYPASQQASAMTLDAETVRVPVVPAPDELRISFHSTRQDTAGPFYEDPSTLQSMRDQTHMDLLPPFDPIVSRGQELLHEIAPNVIEERELSLGVMSELLQRAARWSQAGNLDDAVIAIELVLAADRRPPGVLDFLAKNYPLMLAVFEAFLGDRSRVIALSQQVDEIDVALDRRAMYLLSLLDGTMAASDLLERADMPIVEAYRHLSQLVLRRVVMLV
jgi:serine/threonine protein kinase